jgi:hypothetical protein
MSDQVAYGGHGHVPAPGRSQPAYGDGRFNHETPPTGEEHLDGGTEFALAFAIFAPVTAAYGAIAFGLYLAVNALI